MSDHKDEVELKDIILGIDMFRIELLRKWFIILGCIILFSGVYLYKYFKTQVTYTAYLTFIVDTNEGGGISAVATALAQFGFGNAANQTNLDKILSISKSRKIIDDVLLMKAEVSGVNDVFGNHLIEIYNLHANWNKGTIEELYNFNFNVSDSSSKGKVHNIALSRLYRMIVGSESSKNQLMSSSYNEDSGIMKISIESLSEDFSATFVDSLFNHLSQFYIENSTRKVLNTYNAFKIKSDSIYKDLLGKQFALANIRDVDRSIYLRKSRMGQERLMGQVEILTIAYAEAYKNTQVASVDLEMKTPYIATIDRPIKPLLKNEPSLLLNLIIGSILGGIIGSGFVVLRKIYMDAVGK